MGQGGSVNKEAVRDQWDCIAAAWNRWTPAVDEWLRYPVERMLALAAVAPGSRVLDVAAGSGGQSLAAARLAGPHGSVLATDLSPVILDHALRNAAHAGLANIQIQALDAENLTVDEASFDAAICRLGLMFLPDVGACLAGVHRALRPAGRFSAIVFSHPDRTPFFSGATAIAREYAGSSPSASGPFSLHDPELLRALFIAAGYRNFQFELIPAVLRLTSSGECFALMHESFGALHQLLAGVHDENRHKAWNEIREYLRHFDTGAGFRAPAEVLVVAAEA